MFEILNMVIMFTRHDIRLVVGAFVNVELIHIVSTIYYNNAIEAD